MTRTRLTTSRYGRMSNRERFTHILTYHRLKNYASSTKELVSPASKIPCSKMLASICSLETLILESSSATSPTSEGPCLSRETQWRYLRALRDTFRRLSQLKRSVSGLRSRNFHPPSDLTHSSPSPPLPVPHPNPRRVLRFSILLRVLPTPTCSLFHGLHWD